MGNPVRQQQRTRPPLRETTTTKFDGPAHRLLFPRWSEAPDEITGETTSTLGAADDLRRSDRHGGLFRKIATWQIDSVDRFDSEFRFKFDDVINSHGVSFCPPIKGTSHTRHLCGVADC